MQNIIWHLLYIKRNNQQQLYTHLKKPDHLQKLDKRRSPKKNKIKMGTIKRKKNKEQVHKERNKEKKVLTLLIYLTYLTYLKTVKYNNKHHFSFNFLTLTIFLFISFQFQNNVSLVVCAAVQYFILLLLLDI